jgi:aspartyl/asparaginyl-tRNA synthetase
MDRPLFPTSVKDALQSVTPVDSIQVQAWVRTRRDSKDFSFIELNDGFIAAHSSDHREKFVAYTYLSLNGAKAPAQPGNWLPLS